MAVLAVVCVSLFQLLCGLIIFGANDAWRKEPVRVKTT